MAAEFYQNTKALFEEFKKRELHYLNTQMNAGGNDTFINNISMPLQDHLKAINKRERETEKTYRDLMKQMEELDKRTDQMSLKLEKLNALRNIAISSNVSSWTASGDKFERPLQSYYSSALLQSSPQVLTPSASAIRDFPLRTETNALHLNYPVDYSLLKPVSHSQTTQTDNIFCENCNFPLTLNSKVYASSINRPSAIGNEINLRENERTLHSFSHETVVSNENSNPTNESAIAKSIEKNQNIIPKPDISQFNTALITDESSVAVNRRISLKAEDNNSTEQESLNEPIGKSVKEIQIDDAVTEDFMVDTMEKQYIEIKDDDMMSNSENFEKAVSKSDDESINHEFDFLESDKRNHTKSQPFITNDEGSHPTIDVLFDGRRESVLSGRNSIPRKDGNHSLQVKKASVDSETIRESLNDNNDTKSESSISAGPPSPLLHSENISVASESDSFSEKETPLTASAAYQALLGNVNVTKTSQKKAPAVESDSEDEIENVLATAVRRTSNIAFDTVIPESKPDKRIESIPEAKGESETKTTNLISANKPQNKLSKNTRKVLGLDTSSGSEMEVEVKATTTNKKDEDSDEFDFYD